jgi:2-amino-4-hydroxy-6-hydroxymethyldihydropteridine diphosphokinase
MPTAYIALGSNLASPAGPPEATLAAAAARLESLGRIASRSSLYLTEPVGFAAQPRFVNAVVALETSLTPHQLLQSLLAIELEFGRDRSAGIANGPRTLDLDILVYEKLKISEPDIEIPHPRLAERAFVLIPLHEIAPQLIHPSSGLAVSQLLNILRQNDAEITNNDRKSTSAVVPLHSDHWLRGPGVDGPGGAAS